MEICPVHAVKSPSPGLFCSQNAKTGSGTPPPPPRPMETTWFASGYGSGCSKTALMTVKTALLAPIPRASVAMAVIANVGLFRSPRKANLRSLRRISISGRRPSRQYTKTLLGTVVRSALSLVAGPILAWLPMGPRIAAETEVELGTAMCSGGASRNPTEQRRMSVPRAEKRCSATCQGEHPVERTGAAETPAPNGHAEHVDESLPSHPLPLTFDQKQSYTQVECRLKPRAPRLIYSRALWIF